MKIYHGFQLMEESSKRGFLTGIATGAIGAGLALGTRRGKYMTKLALRKSFNKARRTGSWMRNQTQGRVTYNRLRNL